MGKIITIQKNLIITLLVLITVFFGAGTASAQDEIQAVGTSKIYTTCSGGVVRGYAPFVQFYNSNFSAQIAGFSATRENDNQVKITIAENVTPAIYSSFYVQCYGVAETNLVLTVTGAPPPPPPPSGPNGGQFEAIFPVLTNNASDILKNGLGLVVGVLAGLIGLGLLVKYVWNWIVGKQMDRGRKMSMLKGMDHQQKWSDRIIM